MRSFADNSRIIAVSHNQTCLLRKKALFFKDDRKMRGNSPEKPITIFEIIGPFAVANKIGLGDLDLYDRKIALAINRHQVGAASIWKRYLADCKLILATQ